MSTTLQQIQQIILPQLEVVKSIYQSQLNSGVEMLNSINSYNFQAAGKLIRPTLLILAAGTLSDEKANLPATLQLAAAMEMLHNSTLIHDDVVDNDDLRRGQSSIKHRWGNAVAVLTGDYYLAHVMNLIFDAGNKDDIQMVCKTVMEMSEGELLQLSLRKEGCKVMPAETYTDIIRCKTASLMSTCCAIGNPDLKEFGEHFGMAFQLRDDINDNEAYPFTPQLLQQETQTALNSLQAIPDSIYKTHLTQLTLLCGA